MAMVPFNSSSANLTGITAAITPVLQVQREVLLTVENTGPDAATFELRMSDDGVDFETYGPVGPDLAAVASGDRRTVFVPRNRLEYLQVRGQSDGSNSAVTVKLFHAPGAVGPVNGR